MTGAPASEHEVCWASAGELASALARRERSVSETLDTFIARIERVNPRFNAIPTTCFDEARATARAMDDAPPAEPGPLWGLPIAVKDLAQTKGLRTTFGSPIHAAFVPTVDDLFVERLRAAGAVILGKTNTPEFGAGSQTFNPVFGATLNPYDPTKTCGGSSGGAAVALACGLLPLADGSDLGGSLRNPASFCNVVGFRPTPGRVPAWPKQFSSDPFAVAGPMARSVDDAALLLSAMAGPDPRVPISLPEPGRTFRPPLGEAPRGLRCAWSPDLGRFEVDREVVRVLEGALPVFDGLGASVERDAPDLTDADEIFRVFRAQMFAARLGPDFESQRHRMKDTVVWNVEAGLALEAADLTRAALAHSALLARVASFFERYDFLLCPAAQVPPFPVEQEWVRHINGVEMSTYLDWMGVCYAITVTGCPAVSVPAGFTTDGLPVGLQIVGPRWRDLDVLRFARAFETATGHGHRRPAGLED